MASPGEEPKIFTLRILTQLANDVRREEWDALAAGESPFLEWGWLATLEEARCVGGRTGWSPQHLALFEDDRLVAACPLYLKTNSEGEFVFDYAWANAAYGAGIEYYPKMLVGVPFTPVEGRRFLVAPHLDRRAVVRMLGQALRDLCEENEVSSVHVNFCTEDEAEVLRELGFAERVGFQYKWRNRGYATFDDYLAALRHKRRKEVKRERRELAEQGIEIVAHVGDEIPDALFPRMYELYLTTVDKYVYGRRYLTRRFFEMLPQRFRHNLCFITARRGGELVAGTFNVQKGGALYGRYWGTHEELRFLHFNVCYYATIEHCIAHGMERFEPGAGGEFKWLRGFDPEPTRSMHWLRDPRLAAAVQRFVQAERREIDRVRRAMLEQSQLKRQATDGES
ncbi:MAG TPA: GNAT family N-acetyltransferase [Candidatus Binatia bacterium]